MDKPLMPKATAIWLIDNTTLTFKQIAAYTGLHHLEVQSIANAETNHAMPGLDPITSGQLAREEITRCENDETAELKMFQSNLPKLRSKTKGPKYTPLSRRSDKPDAISWIIKNYPHFADSQIVRLIGTTKNTIENIRERRHWNIQNIRPRHPVELGFCSLDDLQKEIQKADKTLPPSPEDV